jgi:predicted nucleic acid-binding protein
MVGQLMYLVDTNIFLELLLEQERAEEAEQFLRKIPGKQLYLSEFSLYSIGIVLFRLQRHSAFIQLVDDLLLQNRVRLVQLGEAEMQDLARISREFGLDFDDAYQYVSAEKYDLTLVSFDSDFDKTERGRQTPIDILAGQ